VGRSVSLLFATSVSVTAAGRRPEVEQVEERQSRESDLSVVRHPKKRQDVGGVHASAGAEYLRRRGGKTCPW
jgi:hypothetical protein